MQYFSIGKSYINMMIHIQFLWIASAARDHLTALAWINQNAMQIHDMLFVKDQSSLEFYLSFFLTMQWIPTGQLLKQVSGDSVGRLM